MLSYSQYRFRKSYKCQADIRKANIAKYYYYFSYVVRVRINRVCILLHLLAIIKNLYTTSSYDFLLTYLYDVIFFDCVFFTKETKKRE